MRARASMGSETQSGENKISAHTICFNHATIVRVIRGTLTHTHSERERKTLKLENMQCI